MKTNSILLLLIIVMTISCTNKKSNQTNNETKTESLVTNGISKDQNESDSSEYLAKKGFELMSEERIGNIKSGVTLEKIIEEFGKPEEKTDSSFSQVDGGIYQSINYNSKGIFLVFQILDNSKKIVSTIEIKEPCELKTSKQIGIGSSVEEIKNAYRGLISRKFSNSETLVVGSVYGGIFFHLENNKVKKIFIGAGAE